MKENGKWTLLDKLRYTLKKTTPTRVVIFILFILWCGSFVLGLLWAFFASLNTHNALMVDPFGFPKSLNFKNYINAFEVLQTGGTALGDMLFNSIWFTVGTTFVGIATTVMAGYALGRFQFVGRNFIVAAIVIIMMIPIYGSGSATLIMYIKLGFYNSPLFVFTSASMLQGNTLIFMTFFQTLPAAYEEAAKIDGAGYITVFLKIHLPMILPSVSALVLLGLIGGWNNVDAPLYYLPDFPTLATGIYKYEVVSKFNINKPVFFAGIMMCAIPPIILFSLFREKIMTSVTIGGIK